MLTTIKQGLWLAAATALAWLAYEHVGALGLVVLAAAIILAAEHP